jgi:hypothetical protein
VRTKVEFSRRDAIEGTRFEATPHEIANAYGLTPVLSTHYARSAAIGQKIGALAGRTEPQARDIFGAPVNAREALFRLRSLGVPVIRTADAAAVFE